jgi:ATP-dependent protease ClpP protease subunit
MKDLFPKHRMLTLAIIAAWSIMGAAMVVLSGGCSTATSVVQNVAPVSLNCDGCLKAGADAVLVDGVLHYYLYGTTQPYTVRNMSRAILLTESLTDIRDMRLHMFSGGGNAFTGSALADVVIRAQRRGWSVEAYANGLVASAAIPVFAVCYPRYVAFGTMFMVHNIQGSGINPAMKEKITAKYISYLVLMTRVGRVEWIEMLDHETWFTAEEALDWGLVDYIQ